MTEANQRSGTASEKNLEAVLDRIRSDRSAAIILHDTPPSIELRLEKKNEPKAIRTENTDTAEPSRDTWQTEAERKYFLGKLYNDIKLPHGGERIGSTRGNTRSGIANEYNCSEAYVRRSAEFANGLDFLNTICPAAKDLILHQRKCVLEGDICAVGSASEADRMKVVQDRNLIEKVNYLLSL